MTKRRVQVSLTITSVVDSLQVLCVENCEIKVKSENLKVCNRTEKGTPPYRGSATRMRKEHEDSEEATREKDKYREKQAKVMKYSHFCLLGTR